MIRPAGIRLERGGLDYSLTDPVVAPALHISIVLDHAVITSTVSINMTDDNMRLIVLGYCLLPQADRLKYWRSGIIPVSIVDTCVSGPVLPIANKIVQAVCYADVRYATC